MTIELSKSERYAILVALGELENSGDWTSYISEDEYEMVHDGKGKLQAKLSWNEFNTTP